LIWVKWKRRRAIVWSECKKVAPIARGAATLTEGVLKSMMLIKLKIVTVVLLIVSVVGGDGLLSGNMSATEPAPVQRKSEPQ
jgi:hypothetical protein